jgi:hypothetical protein
LKEVFTKAARARRLTSFSAYYTVGLDHGRARFLSRKGRIEAGNFALSVLPPNGKLRRSLAASNQEEFAAASCESGRPHALFESQIVSGQGGRYGEL